MKIKTIRIITYGAFILGAFIAFFARILPALSDYSTALICIGGAVAVSGVSFSIICLRYSACPNCKEFLSFQGIPIKSCPHCCDKYMKEL